MKKATHTHPASRKPGEEALAGSERDFHSIDLIPTLAWSAAPDGSATFLNRHWLEYTGLLAEQADGWGWKATIHPQDVQGLEENWRSSLTFGLPLATEARMRRFDGVYRWFLHRANPSRNESQTIVKWYGICIDIEDRKRAEEALQARELSWRQIVDNVPGFVATMGPMGEVEYLNRQTLDYFGKTDDELKKWSLAGVVHPDDLPRVIETRKSSIEAGQAYEIELRCRRADGIYRWFQDRNVPVRDKESKIIAWYSLLTDIDDRKKAEEALQSAKLDLSVMIDAVPALIHTARPDGYLDYFNRPWLEYVGCPLSDVEGWNWTNCIHPEDLQGIVDRWRACLATGQIFEYETRVRRSDGQYRWMVHRKVPLRDHRGHIVRWYGSSLDIEDRKRSQEALSNALDEIQKSESKLRRVIDAIPALAWCNLPDGPNEFLNKRWHEYTGFSPEESQGWGWQAAFHPDDLPPLMEKWVKMLTSGESDEIEARLRRYDGVYRWFLIRAQAFRDESGKIVRWYGTSTDIDDRKRAEAQLEQAYIRLSEAQQLSKTGSFVADLLADDHNWSEEALRIFEFDSSTKITVEMIRAIVHPEDLPSFDAVIARGMTGTDIDFVFRIVTPRAGMKHIRGMARVMTQAENHSLFIGAIQDVTESKVAEEALNKARSELAEVARVTTLNTLTASIAHEINQPLAGIITNANTCVRLLSAQSLNVDAARETARRTIRDANRASEVITRLRSLFSKKEMSPESMDLNEAAREVITLLSDKLQKKRVLLLTDFDTDLPPVTGDRVQLQQVILNLLRNALEAMASVDDRPRELAIRTAREDGNCVRLSVKDAGVGLAPQAADRLFQPFYTTKSDGMGIGLSISRSIIEAHRGHLWATPNDGAGATFSFSIPSGQADPAKPVLPFAF